MRPISSSPIKANASFSREKLATHTLGASMDLPTTSLPAATTAPRGRGGISDTGTIEVPRVRGRSQSPIKGVTSNLTQHPLNRNLFSKSPGPKSPSKGVVNSDFTGRTFSERERAIELKARGEPIPALPTRTMAEVPWRNGNSMSREVSGESDLGMVGKIGNNVGSSKETTTTTMCGARSSETIDKGSLASTASTTGTESGAPTGSTNAANIPRFELIIWRTFPIKKSDRGQEVSEKTHKCSFPITKKLARRLLNGQKADFITVLNQFISAQGMGTPVTSDPSFSFQLTAQPDGTSFPPEFLDLAEQQFADLVGEIISYQVQGYGRWSIDGMVRRVVIPEGGKLASFGPYLESLVVIALEACDNRWVGLPGFDEDGNLKTIPHSEIAGAQKAMHTGTPDQNLPPSLARLTHGSSAALRVANMGTAIISTPADSQHLPTVNRSPPTTAPHTASMPSKGGATTVLKYPSQEPAGVPIEQRPPSPGSTDGEDDARDEDMSIISLESLKATLKRETPDILPVASGALTNSKTKARPGHAGVHLSTSIIPFPALDPARHHGHARSTTGDGADMARHDASAGPVPTPHMPKPAVPNTPGIKSPYVPQASTSTVTQAGGIASSFDLGVIRKPKRPTTGTCSSQNITATTQRAQLQSTHGRDVFVKGRFEAGKTYVSSRNPSNPLPGTLLSPGLFEQEPTLRMVAPTPPAKIHATQAIVTTDAADTKAAKPQWSKAGMGLARKTSGTLAASKSALRLQVHTNGAKQYTKTLPHPTKSLQDLTQAAVSEAAAVRRRWEESTAASLRKERPPSPIKSRANSPIKHLESPVKRSFAPTQPTAASAARTEGFRALEAPWVRPKSRLKSTASQAGDRTTPAGVTVGLGRGNVSRLMHEGKPI